MSGLLVLLQAHEAGKAVTVYAAVSDVRKPDADRRFTLLDRGHRAGRLSPQVHRAHHHRARHHTGRPPYLHGRCQFLRDQLACRYSVGGGTGMGRCL